MFSKIYAEKEALLYQLNMFKELSNNLYHAYFIEGEKTAVLPELYKFFEKQLGFATRGNPDFWSGEYDALGIDEGRWLKESQLKKACGERKVFVISVNSITREAQNSLLKVFEEPTPNTHFFIISNSAEFLLPTLKSRLIILSRQKQDADESVFENFLSKKFNDRIKFLAGIIEDKSKSGAISFLNSLEFALKSKLEINKNNSHIFEEIIKCRNYLGDRSPSVKLILEHISLLVPVLSN